MLQIVYFLQITIKSKQLFKVCTQISWQFSPSMVH